MRIFLALALIFGPSALAAQEDSIPYTAAKPTIVRSAPVNGAEPTPAVGQVVLVRKIADGKGVP